MKQSLLNNWLNVRSKVVALFGGTDIKINTTEPPEHVDLFFKDSGSFKSRYEKKMNYGFYHPSNTKQWYDPFAAKLTDRGLELSITKNKYINGPITINTGAGLVCSTFNLSYGLYEWNIVLPQGKWLWPAIWLTNTATWPPEIDVLEGYTNEKGKYGNRLKTAVHFGKQPNNKNVTFSHGLGIRKADVLNLKCLWTKESIKIYYNDILVRKVSDARIISQFNENPWMKVVMNNAIAKQSAPHEMAVAPMIVEYFVYYTL